MGNPWPDQEVVTKMIGELSQGQAMATQLLNLFQRPSEERESSAVGEELAANVLKLLTDTVSVLKNEGSKVNNHLDLGTLCDDSRSEGSSESRKRPGVRDKRGCYKRRKNGLTRRVISSCTDDGQAWRKYGQKEILNCKYPRAYFRCTRKYDQGCRATKQVQRMEENPQLYETTYIGVHTCEDVLKAPPIIADSDSWKSLFVSSDSENMPRCEQKDPLPHRHQLSSTVKEEEEGEEGEESKEDTVLSEITDNNLNATSSMEADMFWPDFLALESQNVGAVYSCTDTSSHDLELEIDDLVESVNFDRDFPC